MAADSFGLAGQDGAGEDDDRDLPRPGVAVRSTQVIEPQFGRVLLFCPLGHVPPAEGKRTTAPFEFRPPSGRSVSRSSRGGRGGWGVGGGTFFPSASAGVVLPFGQIKADVCPPGAPASC